MQSSSQAAKNDGQNILTPVLAETTAHMGVRTPCRDRKDLKTTCAAEMNTKRQSMGGAICTASYRQPRPQAFPACAKKKKRTKELTVTESGNTGQY